MCECVATITCAMYGMFTLLECSLDSIEQRELSFTCLATPVALLIIQCLSIVCALLFFPDIRRHVKPCLIFSLIYFVSIHLILRALGKPEELQQHIADLLTSHREMAQLFVHPRLLAIMDRTLALRR